VPESGGLLFPAIALSIAAAPSRLRRETTSPLRKVPLTLILKSRDVHIMSRHWKSTPSIVSFRQACVKEIGSTYFWEESPASTRRTDVRPT